MARQDSPTSPVNGTLRDTSHMVIQEAYLQLQHEMCDAHEKLSNRIATIAVDLHQGQDLMSQKMEELSERNEAKMEEFQQQMIDRDKSNMADLKAMLSSRRHHSSSSASTHRSSHRSKANHEHVEHTQPRAGKEHQAQATERDKRLLLERRVHDTLNFHLQHQGAPTYNARSTRHEGHEHGEPSYSHVPREDRHPRPPLHPRQDNIPPTALRTLEERPNAPHVPHFDHQ